MIEVEIYVDLVLNIFMQELEEVLGDTVPQQGIPDIKFSKVSRVCDHYFMSELLNVAIYIRHYEKLLLIK